MESLAAATEVAPASPTPPNPQFQSPLFGVLPGEIRNLIFALALIQYEDDKEAGTSYPEDSFWFRPGFRAPRRASSTLLRTCRLVHLEGQKVFLQEIEWAFWFYRGPRGRSTDSDLFRFFRGLTRAQAQALESVRLFTQMFWLEDGYRLGRVTREPQFRPSILTITVRYSDWWYWESNTPLRMSEEWLRTFRGNPGLRELRVEYETLSWKRDEMMRIVQRNKKWKLEVAKEDECVVNIDGTGEEENKGEEMGYHLSAEHTSLVEWRWRGTSKLDGKTWRHHGDGDTVEYVVVMDTWKRVEGAMRQEDMQKKVIPHLYDGADDSDSGDYVDSEEDEEDEGGDESE